MPFRCFVCRSDTFTQTKCCQLPCCDKCVIEDTIYDHLHAADTSFQNAPMIETVCLSSDEKGLVDGLTMMVEWLFVECSARGTHSLNCDTTGLSAWAASHHLLNWVLGWAMTDFEGEVLDIAAAESNHRERLIKWYKTYEAMQLIWAQMSEERPTNTSQLLGNREDPSRREARLRESQELFKPLRYKLAYCLRVLESVWFVQSHLDILRRLLKNSSDPSVTDRLILDEETKRVLDKSFHDPEPSKRRSDFEELVAFVLDEACRRSLRKSGDTLYCEKIIQGDKKSFRTMAWVPASFGGNRSSKSESTIKSFIYYVCRRDVHPENWRRLTSMQSSNNLAKFIEECDDASLPFYRPQRNIFSFRNGVYDTTYGDIGKFYHYEDPDLERKNFTACKFTDVNIDKRDLCREWRKIPTPLFQSILDYQRFGRRIDESRHVDDVRMKDDGELDESEGVGRRAERAEETIRVCLDEISEKFRDAQRALNTCTAEEVDGIVEEAQQKLESAIRSLRSCKEETFDVERSGERAESDVRDCLPPDVQDWIYVFIGRMLHELGAQDNWQVIPFVKGKAASGKSTIAKIVQHFFAPENVGVLSNNIEKKFGLMSLVDSFVYVCHEVKTSLELDQADFQCMVSGDEMSIPVKNGMTRTLRWKVPGFLCGNEGTGFKDTQGSITRRLIVISFKHTLDEKDLNPNLPGEILSQELGALIIKCNIAYRSAVSKYQGSDIWSILPSYFKTEKHNLRRDTDALYNAIWDEGIFELAINHSDADADDFFLLFAELEEEYRRKWSGIHGKTNPDALNEDKYGHAFKEAKLRISIETRVLNGAPCTDRFIIGIRRKSQSNL
jgi:hypothetical protein